MDCELEHIMEHIISSIRDAGYEPYDQLFGYLKTGNASFITRTGDARALIQTLDRKQVQRYVIERLNT